MTAETTIPDTTPVRLDYQVMGRRIAAALIDLALLVVLFLVMAGTMGTFGETEEGSFEINLEQGPFALFVLISYGYYVVFEGLISATVGKLVMGLVVVDKEGHPCGLGRALVRNVLRIADGFFFYVPGLICMLVTPTKQRIGDLAAGTLVVKM